jgi:MFS transporter, DHA2 family, multidrug resistance protein
MSDASPTRATRAQWIAVIGGIIGAFMALLDISITNSSLKDIQGGLSASLDEGAWISTAYLISEIIIIPLSGWLSQVFSLKKYIVWNAIAFVIFSMLCGFAWDLPTAMTIIMTYLPKNQQPVGLALFGLATTFAPAIGPTVGGWLTITFSWPLIFYVNLVPGIALIYMLAKYLEPTPPQLGKLKTGDYAGIGLMATFLASLTIVLEEGSRKDWLGDDLIRWLSITSIVSLVLFLFHELRTPTPFVNLRLYGRKNFGIASVAMAIFGCGAYGSIFILPVFLARVENYNALDIGKIIMWSGIPQILVLPLVPKLVRRFDNRALASFGLTMFGISTMMNANLTHDWGIDQFLWSQIVRALGQPFIITSLTSLAYVGIEMKDVGSASGLFNMNRNLGGSVGIGLLGTLLVNRYRLHFARIADSITPFSLPLQEQIAKRSQYFTAHSSYSETSKSVATIYGTLNRESNVMAFGDAFLVLSVIFFATAILVWFMNKPKPGAQVVVADH